MWNALWHIIFLTKQEPNEIPSCKTWDQTVTDHFCASPLPSQAPRCLKRSYIQKYCTINAGEDRGLQSVLYSTHGMATRALLSNFASTKPDNYDIKLAVIFQKQSAEWNRSALIWASGIFLRKTKAHFLKCHVSKKGQQPRTT